MFSRESDNREMSLGPRLKLGLLAKKGKIPVFIKGGNETNPSGKLCGGGECGWEGKLPPNHLISAR